MVARFWGKLPWELSVLEPEKIAKLYALYDIHQDIERYYNSEQSRIQDRLSKEK